MKVLFDTNALLMPFEFKINPYEGVKKLIPNAELITITGCVNELKGLRPRNWESILSLALSNGLKIIDFNINNLPVDDVIVEFAKKNNCVVLTQDRFLKKKLLNNSLRLVVMRQKKYFVLLG